ncbi:MAG: FUSC family protein [Actinomycetota bacterium]
MPRVFSADAPDYIALRRAGRATVVVPLVLVVGLTVIDNTTIAMYGVFAAFVGLVFADYAGPPRSRAAAYTTFLVLGSLAALLGGVLSGSAVLAVVGMFAVGFCITVASSLGGYLPLHVPGVALAFSLSVLEPLTDAGLLDRVLGWSFGAIAALIAAMVLWPINRRRDIELAVADLTDALVAGLDAPADAQVIDAMKQQVTAVQAMVSSPLRPFGPTVREIALFRLIEHLEHSVELITRLSTEQAGDDRMDEVRRALLRAGAVLRGERDPRLAFEELPALDESLERARTMLRHDIAVDRPDEAVDVLRAQISPLELMHLIVWIEFDAARAVTNHPHEIPELTTAPELRDAPVDGFGASLGRAWATIASEIRVRGVVMVNAVRVGAALACAVLISEVVDVEHGFWIVLATLLILRSNAHSTTSTAISAVVGTAIGFAVSAMWIAAADGNDVVVAIVFVAAVAVSGYGPGRFGVGVGQASFAVLVVSLFMLLDNPGIDTGVVRVVDVAIGAGSSVALSFVLWPRGARGMLADTAATAFHGAARAIRSLQGDADEHTAAARKLTVLRREAEAALVAARAENGEPIDLRAWIAALRPLWLSRAMVVGLVPSIPEPETVCPDARAAVAALIDDDADRLERAGDTLRRAAPAVAHEPVEFPTAAMIDCVGSASSDLDRQRAMSLVGWSGVLCELGHDLDTVEPDLVRLGHAARPSAWLANRDR